MSRQQREVHESILRVGGYWEPLAAVARLLEELGELVEKLTSETVISSEVVAELADIWIITTCVANQFSVTLDVEPGQVAPLAVELQPAVDTILKASGRLARVVNYYGGPKNPKKSDEVTPIAPIIESIHASLNQISNTQSVDLPSEIRTTLARATIRDRGRFDSSFDPSTAPSLEQFRSLSSQTLCTFARAARVWGAPSWEISRTLRHNVDSLIPYLIRFCKAAPVEDLDGFAILPTWRLGSVRELGDNLRRLLVEMSKSDPLRRRALDGIIDTPGWQYSFAGLRLFISAFSPVYAENHVRYARHNIILLQPEDSFTSHGIGRNLPGSASIKSSIRQRFLDAGFDYPSAEIDGRVEAAIYLLPEKSGQEPVRWWEPKQALGQPTLF